MADKDDPYKGNGKFTGMVGRGLTEGGTTAVIGAAVGGAIGAFKGNAAKGAKWGAGIAGGLGAVHGGYKGVTNVTAAKEQLERTQTALATTTGLIEEQQRSFTQAVKDERANPGKGRGGRD